MPLSVLEGLPFMVRGKFSFLNCEMLSLSAETTSQGWWCVFGHFVKRIFHTLKLLCHLGEMCVDIFCHLKFVVDFL